MDMENKVCFITGGASGIGKCFVQALLDLGSKCFFVDVNHRNGELLCRTWQDQYGPEKVFFMRVDISSDSNIEQAFEKCMDTFGSLDVVINNAGVDGEINWEVQMQINLFGTIRGTKLAIKYMGKENYGGKTSTRKGGVVLNISSAQGLVAWPAMPTYSAAKAGIIQFTRCIGHPAEFVNHSVKVVSLCPFGVETPMVDYHPYVGMTEAGRNFLSQLNAFDRALSPEEVADAGIDIIKNGSTGSIWYIHKSGDKPLEINEGESYAAFLERNNMTL